MTALAHFSCDYCNSEAKCDAPGHAVVMVGETPTGWWEVPGKGRHADFPGHACPDCVLNGDGVMDDIIKRRDDAFRQVTGLDPRHEELAQAEEWLRGGGDQETEVSD